MGGSENSSIESLTVTHLRKRKEALQGLVAGIHDACSRISGAAKAGAGASATAITPGSGL